MNLIDLLFSFEGRIDRAAYWLYQLPAAVVAVALYLVGRAFGMPYLSWIFAVVFLLPSLAVSVKRCHDRGRSGVFLLLSLVPLLNLWPAVELGFLPGTKGPNEYGDEGVVPPTASRKALQLAYAWAYTVVILAVLVTTNVLANRYDKSWDATANKQFSLADQTIKVVKGLNRDVHIVTSTTPAASRRRATCWTAIRPFPPSCTSITSIPSRSRSRLEPPASAATSTSW
jgi:uncharacterized membrane protein YhaH (DUF805 family)